MKNMSAGLVVRQAHQSSSTQLVAHEQYVFENVIHRNTWMPRLCIPTKDVASNDMLR